MQTKPRITYPTTTAVDFVIIGSGAAGGTIAKELSTRGFSVVVLEQGPRLDPSQFEHDEWKYYFNNGIANPAPVSWRKTEKDVAQVGAGTLLYARLVGGSSVHFTANFWRLHESDFNERSRLGAVPGADLQDWPISYADLEPYYTKVDWEVGISGVPGPFDAPRSRPYPLPPVAVKSSGVLFERGARKLGLHPQPSPMAILSRPYNGRNACQHCGFCMGYGCEYNAKSSTLASVIPVAEATGKCEIRPNSYVRKVELDARGRVTGVIYFDSQKKEQRQRAKAVVLSANGAETPRLLFNSESSKFPHGLANSSGMVGRNLMFNGGGGAMGYFEHPLNEYKSIQVTRLLHDFYETDPKRGFYGGGGIDARFQVGPILFGLIGLPPDAPTWGSGYKHLVSQYFDNSMLIAGHTTSLAMPTNNITLDPKAKDDWGIPAIRVTYKDHPDDIKISQFLLDRSLEIMEAAGARKKWVTFPVEEANFTAHLLGTCRMGKDPRTSVVDINHRAHDVPNLFICDGSSMVTSGRGQPTMTIMALAFRAGERIAELAKRGEV